MPSRFRAALLRGFTIVELLVVIAIIAILSGLILAGLRAAVSAARKTKENSTLKGYFAAWHSYSSSYDALMPGFLDEATQQNWGVTFKDRSGNAIPRALTQTYPWRIASYFDGNMSALIGYRDVETESPETDVSLDWSPQPAALPAWMQNAWGQPGSAVALQPAFGYNAFYLGGWYETTGGVSVPRYLDATWQSSTGSTLSGRIVAQTEAQIVRPTEVTVFASSTYRPASPTGYKAGNAAEDTALGSAWVVPPYLATTEVWSLGGSGNLEGITLTQRSRTQEWAAMLAPAAPAMQDSGSLMVYVDQSVPLRRYNRQAAVVHADGSTMSTGVGELVNMERWIGSAWKPDFRHNP
jgi:prepilin-type N-terminal cleavage/methylation domain-containing protein